MPTADAFTTTSQFPGRVCADVGASIIDDWEPASGDNFDATSVMLVRGFTEAELKAILWNASKLKATHTIDFVLIGQDQDNQHQEWSLSGSYEYEWDGYDTSPTYTETAAEPRARVCPRDFPGAPFDFPDYPEGYFFDATAGPAQFGFNFLVDADLDDGTVNERFMAFDVLRILRQGDEYALVIFLDLSHFGAIISTDGSPPAFAELDSITEITGNGGFIDGNVTLGTFDATIFGKTVSLTLNNGISSNTSSWHSVTTLTGSLSLTIEVSEDYSY